MKSLWLHNTLSSYQRFKEASSWRCEWQRLVALTVRVVETKPHMKLKKRRLESQIFEFRKVSVVTTQLVMLQLVQNTRIN